VAVSVVAFLVEATPNDRIRELKKAGALIAAEIDRLQRLASDAPTVGQGG
jgi:hypothetical protein